MGEKSIFEDYYSKVEFIDRKTLTNEEGVDVIVPIINTNALFETNLYSWYREIPINKLFIGFGGGTDNSLEILKKFPRVIIVDQLKYSDHLYGSQGICIAELISYVETEWFIYLHGDVYLPKNWYDTMKKYQDKYDWYESNSILTTLIKLKVELNSNRAYSGSQMGRKKAFENIIPIIEDGYLQNNEDIIFQELIKKEGYNYGRVFETHNYHQIMNKRGEKEPKYKKLIIEREAPKEWEVKIHEVQARGIIKYCKPKPHLIKVVKISINILKGLNSFNEEDFIEWVKNTNNVWLKYILVEKSITPFKRFELKLLSLYNEIVNVLGLRK